MNSSSFSPEVLKHLDAAASDKKQKTETDHRNEVLRILKDNNNRLKRIEGKLGISEG